MGLSYKDLELVVIECCREWDVPAGIPIGMCAYCGAVPVLKSEDLPQAA